MKIKHKTKYHDVGEILDNETHNSNHQSVFFEEIYWTINHRSVMNLIYKEKVQLQILLDLMKIGGKYLIEIIYKSSIFMKREQEPIAKQ